MKALLSKLSSKALVPRWIRASSLVAVSLSAGLGFLVAGDALACRGLDHQLLPWTHEGGLQVTTGLTYEHLAFDRDGLRGSYGSLQPRAGASWGRWSASLTVPVYAANLRGTVDPDAGFGNPRVRVEAQWIRSIGLSVGVDAEAPLGASKRGLASDHWEGIPFVSLGPRIGSWMPMVSSGVRFAESHEHPSDPHAHTAERYLFDLGAHPEDPVPDSDHGHASADAPLLVNPHEDRELLFHVALGRDWGGRIPAVFYSGQYVLREIDEPRLFGTVGAELGIALFDKYWIAPGIEVPVGSNRRLDWAARVSFDPIP